MMLLKTSQIRQYLQYIINSGGTITQSQFYLDWRPLGQDVFADLYPSYIAMDPNTNILTITQEGLNMMEQTQ